MLPHYSCRKDQHDYALSEEEAEMRKGVCPCMQCLVHLFSPNKASELHQAKDRFWSDIYLPCTEPSPPDHPFPGPLAHLQTLSSLLILQVTDAPPEVQVVAHEHIKQRLPNSMFLQ